MKIDMRAMSNKSGLQRSARSDLVKTIAVFVLIVVGLEAGLRLIEPQLPEPLDWPIANMQAKFQQMSDIAEEGPTIEVAFLGSSGVFDGIDPVAFNEVSNLTAYNAAIAGGISPRSWRWWASHVVVPYLRPQVVVIGVTPVELNSASRDSFWGPLTRSRGYGELSSQGGDLLDAVENAVESFSALFRLRTVLREPVAVLTGFGRNRTSDLDVGRLGRRAQPIKTEYSFSASVEARYREDHLLDFRLEGEDLDELTAMIEDLESSGMEVVLINMPVTGDLVAAMPGGSAQYAAFVSALESVASNLEADFIDKGRSRPNEDDFWDPGHLDHGASQEFSLEIGSEIEGLSNG